MADLRDLPSLVARAAAVSARTTHTLADVDSEDFLLLFLINNPSFALPHGCLQEAVRLYFTGGRRSACQLDALLHELGPADLPSFTLLEFASGFGRVTRHLARAIPNAVVTACDIHPRAVDFITRRLGVPAIASDRVPEHFAPRATYDVVFVLSFFSHLPRETWGRWLKALYAVVASGGFLVFTTHGRVSAQKHLGDPELSPDGFWYGAESEQKDLDPADYGLSIVSRAFVDGQATAHLGVPVTRFDEGVWFQHQDQYVIAKPPRPCDGAR